MNSSDKITDFKKLHESGCFVIPNPWDKGSAIYLESIGYKSLATTSAGVAFSLGVTDGIKTLSLEDTLSNIRDIVSATSLPVNADFQSGYADKAEGVATNVDLCIKTGVAGLSIEDSTGDESKPLYERDFAIDRIRAARAAIDSSGKSVLLTARCEARLVDSNIPIRTIVDRLVAYSEAGGDCLFAPGVNKPGEIEAIVKAVSPKPVNILISSAAIGLSVSRLAELGVRRISVGSALARTAWGAFIRAAKDIIESGSFDKFSTAASFAELDSVFRGR